jgi:Fur family transcriptional regulator, ferric uptake regulator
MKAEPSETLAVQQRIREAGLRATAPRVAVLGVLDGARGPLTHGQVHRRLAAQGLDRATVYRNLRDLSEAGLLLRTDLGDHVWRYVVSPADGTSSPEAWSVSLHCDGRRRWPQRP